MLRTIRGITLIELVFAVAISSVMLFVVFLAYSAGVRSFTQEISRFDIFWDGYRGLETITEEIRECLDVTSAESSSISFWWRDLNNNSSMEANEVVSYSLFDQNLIRTIGIETKPVAHNVAGLSLDYDNQADPTLVTITLTMTKDKNVATLESKANIRNK